MNNTFFCARENGKLHRPRTILTGFGFMASSIAWAIYDPYITKILEKLLNMVISGDCENNKKALIEAYKQTKKDTKRVLFYISFIKLCNKVQPHKPYNGRFRRQTVQV